MSGAGKLGVSPEHGGALQPARPTIHQAGSLASSTQVTAAHDANLEQVQTHLRQGWMSLQQSQQQQHQQQLQEQV